MLVALGGHIAASGQLPGELPRASQRGCHCSQTQGTPGNGGQHREEGGSAQMCSGWPECGVHGG